MRFIDCEQRDGCAFESLQEALICESLGGDIEQLKRSVAHALPGVTQFVWCEGGIHAGGFDTAFAKCADLVFHQRNERRYNKGKAGQAKRGQLVAEGFAAAGGEDREGAPPGGVEKGFNDLLLAVAELGEAEASGEQFERRRWADCGRGVGRLHGVCSGRILGGGSREKR